MTYAGLTITDADSLMAAADELDELEAITCPECDGARTVGDLSPDTGGWVTLLCPGCNGSGTMLVAADPEPEPPTPAAPALAVVVPLYRCETCRDTGRVGKPSAFFPGRTIEGFCPDCTPHYDFARRGFVNCGAATADAGEATPPPAPAPVPFDRHAHCQRVGQLGGLKTLERHGRAHFVAIGKAGYRAAVKAHGVAYVNGLLKANRWDGPRRPDLLADLAAGRVLADLDRAA
jgi:hypothetical protein